MDRFRKWHAATWALLLGFAGSACDQKTTQSRLGDPALGAPTHEEISFIERTVTMPAGSNPLVSYFRVYARTVREGQTLVLGQYMMGAHFEREDRTIFREISPSVFVVDEENLPLVLDGGCDVVIVEYDAHLERVGAACSGVA
ncbi:MAG: hypothetical protein EOP84_20355 [Verrucomicrobiaceae bacterium]|nr:MAG: hypothetical protein EOP84_20355 [Verrucomicrobiaceae bacterium]